MIAAPLLLWSTEAHALVTRHLCLEMYTSLTDEASGDLLHDGALPSGKDAYARGIKVTLDRQGAVKFNDFADEDGCFTAINLDGTGTYTLVVTYDGEVSGMDLQVRSSTGSIITTTVQSGVALWPDNTTFAISATDAGNVYATAAHALHLRTPPSYMLAKFFLDDCPGSSGNCYEDGTGLIYVTDVDWKYQIAKLLGHSVFDHANGLAGTSATNDAALNGCTPTDSPAGVNFDTKEFQSEAAYVGVSAFYSALAFNSVSESDCEYEIPPGTGINWDLDSNPEEHNGQDPTIFSCEGAIGGDDGHDFVGDHCLGSGESNNRSTEIDWLRALWDFRTDENVGLNNILTIWDGADPDDWNATGTGTGGDYPSKRFRDSASAQSLLSEWNNVDNVNGVQR